MKLLKKLLPFATIASVATIGLSTMAACSCDKGNDPEPEKEYEIEVVPEDFIEVTPIKFTIGNTLIIKYKFTEEASPTSILDKTSSTVKIGIKEYKVSTLLTDDNEHAIIIPSEKVNNKKIIVDLIATDPQEPFVAHWLVKDKDEWTEDMEDQRTEGFDETIATYPYLVDVQQNKNILAGDLAYSYLKDEDLDGYSELITSIGDIDPDSNRVTYTIECIPDQSASTPGTYSKLEFINFPIAMTYCYNFNGVGKEIGWTIDPLVYWFYDSQAKAYAIRFLQHDFLWGFKYTYGEDANDYYEFDHTNSESKLTNFITNFVINTKVSPYDYPLSFWTRYWEKVPQ